MQTNHTFSVANEICSKVIFSVRNKICRNIRFSVTNNWRKLRYLVNSEYTHSQSRCYHKLVSCIVPLSAVIGCGILNIYNLHAIVNIVYMLSFCKTIMSQQRQTITVQKTCHWHSMIVCTTYVKCFSDLRKFSKIPTWYRTYLVLQVSIEANTNSA